MQLLLAACAAAVAAAFAKPPFWFCVACPIVLGLAAPLLINFGLGAAAEAACEQMQLDPQSCTDLWWVVAAMRPCRKPVRAAC